MRNLLKRWVAVLMWPVGITLSAQTAEPTPFDTTGIHHGTWLVGAGRTNALDTYISPLEYTGPTFTLAHLTERGLRHSGGRVTFSTRFDGRLAYVTSQAGNHHAYDGDFTFATAWRYNWCPRRGLKLALGGMAEADLGFTYNTGLAGNNPAQARATLAIGLSALVAYDSRLGRLPLTLTLQADAPMVGMKFQPHYGQSYYEIFELGHQRGHLHVTWPGNAPTLHTLLTAQFHFRHLTATVGYLSDVRQSRVGELKYHSWNNSFVIGFVRHFRLTSR